MLQPDFKYRVPLIADVSPSSLLQEMLKLFDAVWMTVTMFPFPQYLVDPKVDVGALTPGEQFVLSFRRSSYEAARAQLQIRGHRFPGGLELNGVVEHFKSNITAFEVLSRRAEQTPKVIEQTALITKEIETLSTIFGLLREN